MTDYEKICDFANLYKAHRRARLGKQKKREVIDFETELSANLIKLKRELESGDYKMKGYYSFEIFEPKRREIFASHYADRVVQHCVCDEVLIPAIAPRLIYDNAACQPNKGTHFAMDRLTGFMRDFYRRHGAAGYFLKCDIRKYFQNIDHDVLKKQLRRAVFDPDVLHLLDGIIDSYHSACAENRGLPLGNQSSQWFAIYYLDPLDRFIKEKLHIRYYVRYMDDLILIHPDKTYLKACLARIRDFTTNAMKLELNEKTQVFPLKNGISFLGYRFYLSQTGKVVKRIRAQAKTRMKRHLRLIMRMYARGDIGHEKIHNILASYHGHYRYGHCYRLWEEAMRGFVLVRHHGGEHDVENHAENG